MGKWREFLENIGEIRQIRIKKAVRLKTWKLLSLTK